ncbi:hypothetical protein GCM10029964_128350 [Kibdelosporangium lantanae]
MDRRDGANRETSSALLLQRSPRADVVIPTMVFTDSAGIRWVRSDKGDLTRWDFESAPENSVDPGAHDAASHPTLYRQEELDQAYENDHRGEG